MSTIGKIINIVSDYFYLKGVVVNIIILMTILFLFRIYKRFNKEASCYVFNTATESILFVFSSVLGWLYIISTIISIVFVDISMYIEEKYPKKEKIIDRLKDNINQLIFKLSQTKLFGFLQKYLTCR